MGDLRVAAATVALTALAACGVERQTAPAAASTGGGGGSHRSGGLVIGHQQANLAALKAIPEADIRLAKERLVVAYGHTSHGSQIVTGMQPLDKFMGGRGLYTFNGTGEGGALRLIDGAGYNKEGGLAGDAGWAGGKGQRKLHFEDETVRFLGSPNGQGRGSKQPDVNVMLWSFCGQMSGWDPSREVQWYLDGLDRLDAAYPGVTFVRMTGHLDGSGVAGRLHQNNELVRQACRAKGKYLFDFADIESYDPDGNEYLSRGGDDACGYDGGNWAKEWQARHQEGRDWYRCSSAHSQPLNANRKAYAAWALFAALAKAAG